jgi:hypothetical protein
MHNLYRWPSKDASYQVLIHIDRCELCGFICEINSGISHVKYQFIPPELLLHNYKYGGYIPCCVTVNTRTIVTEKNPRNVIDDSGT